MRKSYWAQDGNLEGVMTVINDVMDALPLDADVAKFASLVNMSVRINENNNPWYQTLEEMINGYAPSRHDSSLH